MTVPWLNMSLPVASTSRNKGVVMTRIRTDGGLVECAAMAMDRRSRDNRSGTIRRQREKSWTGLKQNFTVLFRGISGEMAAQ